MWTPRTFVANAPSKKMRMRIDSGLRGPDFRTTQRQIGFHDRKGLEILAPLRSMTVLAAVYRARVVRDDVA
jgi:hypothetical protein